MSFWCERVRAMRAAFSRSGISDLGAVGDVDEANPRARGPTNPLVALGEPVLGRHLRIDRGGDTLTATSRERLFATLVTSVLNGTVHCASGARARLEELGADPAIVAAIGDGPEVSWQAIADDPRLAAILRYAVRLTRAPAQVSRADLDGLREAGLSDLDILDLNNLVAYYNYVNRVANGLGLRTRIERREHALAAVPA